MAEQDYWYEKWEWDDWLLDDELGACEESTRGIWADALGWMFKRDRCGKLSGTVESLARLCRTTPQRMEAAIEDLKRNRAATVSRRKGADGHAVVTLINRRMRREYVKRSEATKRKRNQRKRDGEPPPAPPVTRPVTGKSHASGRTGHTRVAADSHSQSSEKHSLSSGNSRSARAREARRESAEQAPAPDCVTATGSRPSRLLLYVQGGEGRERRAANA